MSDPKLTIVLPIYNHERQLRSTVLDILDLAGALHFNIEVVLVDDGSTDDTYEAACELARVFPQLVVLRQPFRQGLRSALELVRNSLEAELVLVHDGVSSVDMNQLQQMLLDAISSRYEPMPASSTDSLDSVGSRRFCSTRSLHENMQRAHQSLLAFSWLHLEKPLVPRRRRPVEAAHAASGIVPSFPSSTTYASSTL